MLIRFNFDVELPLSHCPEGPTRPFSEGEVVEISAIQPSVSLEEGQAPTVDLYFRGLCFAYGVPTNLFTEI